MNSQRASVSDRSWLQNKQPNFGGRLQGSSVDLNRKALVRRTAVADIVCSEIPVLLQLLNMRASIPRSSAKSSGHTRSEVAF